MPIDGYTTTISSVKTASDIQNLLAKAKVRSTHTEYGSDGQPSGMSFSIMTEWGLRDFSLPIRWEGVLQTLRRDRVEKRFLTEEHARKVAWRIALKWLQAQLALIDAGMVTLPEVFFPYLIGGWDDHLNEPVTMYKKYASTQKEIES